MLSNPGRIAQLRSQAYTLLSLVFRQPDSALLSWFGSAPAARLLSRLVKGLPDPGPGERLASLVRADRTLAGAGELPGLVAEYHYLFSPTPTVRVPLWASAYSGGEQKVMGEPALLAREIYAWAGYTLSPDFSDQPDHLTLQLQFMSLLSNGQWGAWKRRDPGQATGWAALDQEFVSRHLFPWIVHGLLPRLQQWRQDGFYWRAVTALADLLTMDLNWTQTLSAKLTVAVDS